MAANPFEDEDDRYFYLVNDEDSIDYARPSGPPAPSPRMHGPDVGTGQPGCRADLAVLPNRAFNCGTASVGRRRIRATVLAGGFGLRTRPT